MTTPIRKKLIEVSIPLEAINKASAREKSIRHGHPSTLHLWWARRPLAACRAVLFAQLVDDPSAWPDRFVGAATQDAERKRLHKVIEAMVPWEASNNETILNAARWEIARSVAWGLGEEPPAADDGVAILDYLQTKAPPVYDPFSGGGSIPLEAQRLGLRAYGSDLNPVAVLIGKALVEIPPKFAGRPPVNPVARVEARNGALRSWKGAQGLAADVRYYGAWMRDEATKRIGYLYPKATLPDGSQATVIAWLWARTVRSPDPAAKGAMVPLVSSYMLQTKDSRKAWVEPIIDPNCPDGYRFSVRSENLSKADEIKLSEGTKTGRATFRCLLTGSNISGSYIDAEAQAGRMKSRMMAVVAEGTRSRVYFSPSSFHEEAAIQASDFVAMNGDELDLPQQECRGTFASNAQGRRYCFSTFSDYFTPRQLITLATFSDLVSEVRERIILDAADLKNSTGRTDYADAIAIYLALSVDRSVMGGNTLTRWNPVGPKAQHAFGLQGLPMIWSYAETNLLGEATGSLDSGCEMAINALISTNSTFGSIEAMDAISATYPPGLTVFSTDPPYYDNVGYADLSDFFYVWLRRSLKNVKLAEVRRLTTPKEKELIASPARHGGRAGAEEFFMRGMEGALRNVQAAASDQMPLTIYYAFKQAEMSQDGISSAGWASFLQAVFDAGFVIDGTWPLRTEMATRMVGQNSNALASSVVLVCRTRSGSATVATRADFVRALKREMPTGIDNIRKAGVGPVDMQQSVIGPGMGVFTRFARVLEDDDSTMPVKTALSLINRVWAEIENELDTSFDPATQVALAWFATYGFDTKPSGELITLANAKNIPPNALFSSGVFENQHGRARLIPRADLPAGWTPTGDKELTVWECVQHTARVLNAADGGGAAAGALVAPMGAKAAAARALAYRLFDIATQKSWAAEALVYNELAEEWPKLEDLATSARAGQDAPRQASLL